MDLGLYSYARNNPVALVDPDGRDTKDPYAVYAAGRGPKSSLMVFLQADAEGNVSSLAMTVHVHPNAMRYSQGYSDFDDHGNWGNMDFSSAKNPHTNVGSSGCGPTSMAEVFTSLTGILMTPQWTAQVALATGARERASQGVEDKFFRDFARTYALGFEKVTDAQTLFDRLSDGRHMAIVAMGPGNYTSVGHMIALAGTATDDKGGKWFMVDDPAGGRNYNKPGGTVLNLGNGYSLASFDTIANQSSKEDGQPRVYYIYALPGANSR
jgi:hypothetical protein